MDLLVASALFVFGLAFGSFLNVCISRLPRDESVVRPRSHCPACDVPIRWYDNLPVISWLFLRGHCRDCHARISPRYPAVELLTAVLFVAVFWAFGPTWLSVKFCIFCFLVLGLIFMDAETGLLPGEFTYTGIVLGLALSWLAVGHVGGTQFLLQVCGIPGVNPHELSLIDSLLAATIGAGFFYLAWAVYYLVRKRHGLGFGDIALMAMIGAFLGLKLAVFVIFAATLSASLGAVLMLMVHSLTANGRDKGAADAHAGPRPSFLSRELPFGVFLGVSAIAALFIGEAVWGWYLNFFR